MRMWSIDADDIRTADAFNESLMVKTEAIKDFLEIDRDTKFFIVAPKGVGKTYLLTAKRIIYQNKNITCLPANALRDMFIGNTILNKSTRTILSDVDNWSPVWNTAILLSIFKHIGMDINLSYAPLQKIFTNKILITVSDIFQNLLTSITDERKYYYEMTKECNSVIIPLARNINHPIAVFLDKVDEYFHKHIFISDIYEYKSIGEKDPTIWFNSQLGLVQSIYDLTRLNHHLKIFASIRKEAFDKIRITRLYRQYRGSATEIKYSFNDLKEIFIKNISVEEDDRIAKPSLKRTDPIQAFMGISKFHHSYVTGRYEDPFSYIYRHTLQRPRDFMAIGQRIASTRVDERNEDKLKNEVDRETYRTTEEYLFQEIAPYFPKINFNNLFSFIDSNVLDKQSVIDICSIYNDVPCKGTSCRSCDHVHIFCNLYKLGLLGVIKKDRTSNELVQFFQRPGERTLDSTEILPSSVYYLIHPVLYARIFEANERFKINDQNIIGYELPWVHVDRAYRRKKRHRIKKTLIPLVPALPSVDKKESGDSWSSHEIYMSLLSDILTFNESEPKAESALSRPDIKMALAKLMGEEQIVVLDLGCGTGPLIKALNLLDPEQLKTISYIGINYKNIKQARRLAQTIQFDKKVNKCFFYTFEDIENLNLKADFVFIIDVLHLLDPISLVDIFKAAVHNLNKRGQILIYETLKNYEPDRIFWDADDLRYIFKDFQSLNVFSHNDQYEYNSKTLRTAAACIKKEADTEISDDFRDRIWSLYRNKLNAISHRRRELLKNNKESKEYTVLEEIALLEKLELTIRRHLDRAQNIWRKV